MIFSGVKSIVIPEGNVTAIHSGNGLVWSAVDKYTWESVAASIAAGTYKTRYTIGDTVPLDLGNEGVVNMQIVGFDVDTLTGGGTAAISWISKEILTTPRAMNPELIVNADGTYQEGTGAVGGWAKSAMRTYLEENIKPLIPANVAALIKSVTKYSMSCDAAGTIISDEQTEDMVWLPSHREIYNMKLFETKGEAYSKVFTNATSRAKYRLGADATSSWWLRTVNDDSDAHGFMKVNASGTDGRDVAEGEWGVVLGFCT